MEIFQKNKTYGHNPFRQATNCVPLSKLEVTVEENMDNGDKRGRKGLTRGGMRSVTVRLPNGATRHFLGEDLFPE